MKSFTDDKTFFEEHGDALVRRMGLSKTEFAEKMGVKKQNVNAVFATKNILVLKKAAQVLDVPLETLIADATEQEEITINGYVEVNRELYRVRDKEELLRVLQVVEELEDKRNHDTEDGCQEGHLHTTCNDCRRDVTSSLDIIECLHHTDHSSQESERWSHGDEECDPRATFLKVRRLNSTVSNNCLFNLVSTFVHTEKTLIED